MMKYRKCWNKFSDAFHQWEIPVSYTHLRAHETRHDIVCRLLLENLFQKASFKRRKPLVNLLRRPPKSSFRSRDSKPRVRRRQAKARDWRRWLAAAAAAAACCGSTQCGWQRLWLLEVAGCLPKASAQQLLLQGLAVGLPREQRVSRHGAASWVEIDWLVPDGVSLCKG